QKRRAIPHQNRAGPERWPRGKGGRRTRVEQKRVLSSPVAIWSLRVANCPPRRVNRSFDGPQTQRSASVFLRREDYLAHICCGRTCNCCCARSSLVWRLQCQSAVDANDSYRWLLPCIPFQRARTHHPAFANDV